MNDLEMFILKLMILRTQCFHEIGLSQFAQTNIHIEI